MAFDSYTQLRLAEDVADQIYLISPIDNPVASMSKTTRATGKYHQWTEDELNAAGENARAEGAAAVADESKAVAEKGNYCQILSKTASITGTLEKVDKYGRNSEMAYQLEQRYSEMANDEELAIVGAPGGTRQTADDGEGNGGTRKMGCLQSQLHADVTSDAGIWNAGGAITTTEMLESMILEAHLATYTEGGNPSYMVVPPAVALYLADFAYSAGRTRDLHNEKKLVNCIDLYVDPYGELDVILDRHCDPVSILLLDFNYLATPVLRTTTDWQLAVTGDFESRQVLRESTFAVLNSKAGAAIDNVPTGLTPAA